MYPPLGTSFPLGQCCECMVRDVPLWGGEHTSPNPGGHTPPRAPALPSRIYRPPLQGATPPSVVSVAGARALLCSYMASFFGPTMVHGLLVRVGARRSAFVERRNPNRGPGTVVFGL